MSTPRNLLPLRVLRVPHPPRLCNAARPVSTVYSNDSSLLAPRMRVSQMYSRWHHSCGQVRGMEAAPESVHHQTPLKVCRGLARLLWVVNHVARTAGAWVFGVQVVERE